MFILATEEKYPGIQLSRAPLRGTVEHFTVFVPFYLKYIFILKLLYKLSSFLEYVYYFEDFIDN